MPDPAPRAFRRCSGSLACRRSLRVRLQAVHPIQSWNRGPIPFPVSSSEHPEGHDDFSALRCPERRRFRDAGSPIGMTMADLTSYSPRPNLNLGMPGLTREWTRNSAVPPSPHPPREQPGLNCEIGIHSLVFVRNRTCSCIRPPGCSSPRSPASCRRFHCTPSCYRDTPPPCSPRHWRG